MKLVRRKKIDLIMAHKLDRLGRSLPHLAQMIGEFEANGVALFIPGQGIDTRQDNPAGRLQLHILMAVADLAGSDLGAHQAESEGAESGWRSPGAPRNAPERQRRCS